MARYIDMDKLGKMIEARAEQLIEGKDALLYVAKWLNLLPEADVAPRAEVAREIFEEIEFDIHQLMFDRDETRAIAIEGIIANLKKKYTEDKTNGCEEV